MAIPALTTAQHRRRVTQLRRAGCKVSIKTLPSGDRVVLKKCPPGASVPPMLENQVAPNTAGYLILAGFAAAALYTIFRPKKAAAAATAASCPIITPESLKFYNETFKIAVVQLADETEPPVGRVGQDNRITLYSYTDGTFLPFGANGTPQTFSQPLIVIVGEDQFWRYEGTPGREVNERLSPEDRENYCKLLLGGKPPATVSGIRWM